MAIKKIAVLCGGDSSERAISLKSGDAVTRALKQIGQAAFMLDARGDFMSQLKHERPFVFVAMHGKFGEDGGLQRLLDQAGLSYSGSHPAACRLAMDKVASRLVFESRGLCVPKGLVLTRMNQNHLNTLKYPVFVKPCSGGSSIGMTLVNEAAGMQTALLAAFREDDCVLVEERVVGREMTAGILGERVLPLLEIMPRRAYFDYEAKYADQATSIVEPRLNSAERSTIETAALTAHHALGLSGFSRVDLFWTGAQVVVLEANAIPGLTEKSLLPKMAALVGIPFGELCLKMIEQSICSPRVIQS